MFCFVGGGGGRGYKYIAAHHNPPLQTAAQPLLTEAKGSAAALHMLLGRWVLPARELLEQEVGACRELLAELQEPEQKWALLALVYILHHLSPLDNHAEIMAMLDK